jgi:hypothetical protein
MPHKSRRHYLRFLPRKKNDGYYLEECTMALRMLPVAIAIAFCVPCQFARAEDPARTERLPPALAALGVGADTVVTDTEAGRVRGQALDEAGILERMAQLEQRALELDLSASQFSAGTGVVELPDRILSSNGFLFGDGVIINQNTGSGAIFDFDGGSLLLLSDLKGQYSVTRTAEGVFLIGGGTP